MPQGQKLLEEIFHKGTPTVVLCMMYHHMIHIFSYVSPYQQLLKGRAPVVLLRRLTRELSSRNQLKCNLHTKIQSLPHGPLKELIQQQNGLAGLLIYSPVSDKNPALYILLIYPIQHHTIIYMGTWHFMHETNLLYNLRFSQNNLVIKTKSRLFDALNAVIALEMKYDIEYYNYFLSYFKEYRKDIHPYLMYLFMERLFISEDSLNDDIFEEICIRFPYLKELHEMNQVTKRISSLRLRRIDTKYKELQFFQLGGFKSMQCIFTTLFLTWKIWSKFTF